MTTYKALTLALEALEFVNQTGDTQTFDMCYANKAITAIKQALAQPEGSDAAKAASLMYLYTILGVEWGEDPLVVIAKIRNAQPEQERNFCSRCGKRLGSNDWDVHTCTPLQRKE